MTAQAHEVPARWDNASCYRCGDGTIAVSTTDGRVNTSSLLAYDPNGFDAAAYCDQLVAHDHNDWYLPSGGTGADTEQYLFWQMRQIVGNIDGIGLDNTRYWSSTESSADRAYAHRFTDGDQGDNNKQRETNLVRCVRR